MVSVIPQNSTVPHHSRVMKRCNVKEWETYAFILETCLFFLQTLKNYDPSSFSFQSSESYLFISFGFSLKVLIIIICVCFFLYYAALEYVMGPRGSALICGYTNYHCQLESCLADLKKKEVYKLSCGKSLNCYCFNILQCFVVWSDRT